MIKIYKAGEGVNNKTTTKSVVTLKFSLDFDHNIKTYKRRGGIKTNKF